MSFERKAKYHTLSCMKQTISSKKKKKSSVICTVEDCKLNVRSRKLLVKHFREAHAELVPSNSCSVCSKTFNDRSNFKRHLLTHRGQMEKECPICKKKFWKYYLPKHIKRNHTHNHIPLIVTPIIDEIIQMVSDFELLKELGTRLQLEREQMGEHMEMQLGIVQLINIGVEDTETNQEHTENYPLDKGHVDREQVDREDLRGEGVETELKDNEQRDGKQFEIQLVGTQMVERELVERELVERELEEIELVERELVEREMVDKEVMERELVGGELLGRQLVGRVQVGRGHMCRRDVGRQQLGIGQVGQGQIGRADVGGKHVGGEKAGRGQVGSEQIDRVQLNRVQMNRVEQEAGMLENEGVYLVPLQSIATGAQFVCNVCSYTAGSTRNLNRHRESMHSESIVNCPRTYCNKKFPTKFIMQRHLVDCFLFCDWDNCDKKFKYPKRYDSHQRAHKVMMQRY